MDSDLILGTLKVLNHSQYIMTFSIYNDKRKLILNSIADDGCAISFDEMLPVGTYYYKDINNNLTKFKIENDTDLVQIEAGKSSTEVKTLPKNRSENEFVLYKVDDSGKPLMGAVFGLIDIYGSKICFSCSDRDGKVTFKNLKKDTYLVREIDAPEGYKESEMNVIFTVDDDWVNQSERINRGAKFEDVYIVVSDELYTENENIFDTNDMCSRDEEITTAAEEITNVAGIVLSAEIR